MSEPNPMTIYDSTRQELICAGDWELSHIPQIESKLKKITWPKQGHITFDGASIHKMDSAGAWLIAKTQNLLESKGITVTLQKFSEDYRLLLSLVSDKLKSEAILHPPKQFPWLGRLGKTAISQLHELKGYLTYVGQLTIECIRIGFHPLRWRWNALANVIYQTGFLALPIIALLSFMIGVVITYQMGLQLRNYGANVFIVDLLGLGILREFGPLLTAIMVAGRTGSAFTAELGMMKLNQEIDALNTMGITPAELLLIPRIIGLAIVLPLLTVWADIFGVFGGMVMSNNMLNISWYDFLHRFPQVIPIRNLYIGLGKAPVFALIIASIGTYEGMNVSGSAESVGKNTTRSVVLSIFFIIVADAIFSILFSKFKL